MPKPNQIKTSKYTPFTFLPLNIYYQFTKYNNLFFLITLILLSIPSISPFTPFPYLIAFSLIISVSMIKDALEDRERHRQDVIINKRLACVVKDGRTKKICVEDINCGDAILVRENEEVPADIVLLSCNHAQCRSFCFVETSNLDGENNLKRKIIASDDNCLCTNKDKNRQRINTHEDGVDITDCDRTRINRVKDFQVEETGELLNDIKCIVKTSRENLFQSDKNVLLKGSRLKNTTYIIGIAISVGTNTKQSKNLIVKDIRVSLFERMVNKQLCFVFVGYFFVLAFTSMLASLFLKRDDMSYLFLDFNRSSDALILTGTNYILFSYLVPISLFVTIEIARIFSGMFIRNDKRMWADSETTCRNTNVVEDLGIIDHILTDKTGTLTNNEMVLKYIHLKRETHLRLIRTTEDDLPSPPTAINSASSPNLSDPHTLFVLAILCCNSVERFYNKYEGQSQDEISILEGVKTEGQLVERTETNIVVTIGGTTMRIPIIMLMEFTSKRQRMSIVVKIKEKFLLFSKGSDQIMLPLMSDVEGLKEIIDDNSFYRSLVVGYKEIGQVGAYVNEYKHLGFEGRGERVESIFNRMVAGRLTYLGTTFVEDSLQEGTKDTIKDLIKAEIKIWMVTGDKRETASSCGVLCGMKKKKNKNGSNNITNESKEPENENPRNTKNKHIKNDIEEKNSDEKNNNINVPTDEKTENLSPQNNKSNDNNDDKRSENEITKDKKINRKNGTAQFPNQKNLSSEAPNVNIVNVNIVNINNNNENNAHSINNKAQKYGNVNNNYVLANRFKKENENANSETEEDSCELISASDTIKKLEKDEVIKDRAIVFRASPEQKAKIARLLVHKKAKVLSIGDGNNDVMMLQSSCVGVGIKGSEGTQASLSADFSVPQFRCLKRLMFVHGRYTFMRFSKMCVNSLYKNLLLIFLQLYYNFFNGYSGRPVFNLFFLSYFNVLFTSIVPFYIAVFDKDKDEEELMANPIEYKNTSKYFSHKMILLNVVLAILKASIIFWVSYFCFRLKDFTKGNGVVGGYSALNNYFSLFVFLTVFFRQYRMINHYNSLAYIAMLLTWILYFGTLFGIQEFNESTKNSAFHLYGMPVFYFALISIFGLVLFVDVIYDTFHKKLCK